MALTKFADPTHNPPIAAARHIADNLSDIKAHVAANRNGIRLLVELIDKFKAAWHPSPSLPPQVHFYILMPEPR